MTHPNFVDWREEIMLTKTLKFDDDVLEILRCMNWSDDGLLGKLTCGQLDRKMYEKVNKALDVMGGKWNRSKGGHVFQVDPRPSVEGLLENGNLIVRRDGFFETPRAVVERMLELVPPSNDSNSLTLEPSAGLGAIVRVLDEYGVALIVMVEKDENRAEMLEKEFSRQDRIVCNSDFLFHDNEYPYDRVYMNPPFEESQDIDHVRHAYDLLAPDGIMVSVMSEGAFFRTDKKSLAFRQWLDSVGGYSETLPEGSFKESGTGVNTRLVVIEA